MRGRGCDPTKSGPAKLNLSSSAVLWSFEIDSEKTTRSRSRSRRTVSATHCLKSFTKKDGQTPAGLASLPILARRGPIPVKGLMTPSLARRRRKLRVSGSPGCGPTPLRAAVVSVPPGRATPCPSVGPHLALRRFHASLSRGMTRSASLATSSSSKHSTIVSRAIGRRRTPRPAAAARLAWRRVRRHLLEAIRAPCDPEQSWATACDPYHLKRRFSAQENKIKKKNQSTRRITRMVLFYSCPHH